MYGPTKPVYIMMADQTVTASMDARTEYLIHPSIPQTGELRVADIGTGTVYLQMAKLNFW